MCFKCARTCEFAHWTLDSPPWRIYADVAMEEYVLAQTVRATETTMTYHQQIENTTWNIVKQLTIRATRRYAR